MRRTELYQVDTFRVWKEAGSEPDGEGGGRRLPAGVRPWSRHS